MIDKIELIERPAEPNAQDRGVVRLLQFREQIRVLNGSQCVNDVTWWEVWTESGNTGWIQEVDPNKGRLVRKDNR